MLIFHIETLKSGLTLIVFFLEAFNSCAKAGPNGCSMARPGASGEDLEAAAWKMAESLKSKSVPVKGSIPIDYDIIRQLFSFALYRPLYWNILSSTINVVELNQTNSPEFVNAYNSLVQSFTAQAGVGTALFDIHCSDRTVRSDSIDDFRPVQDKLSKTSKVMDGSSTSLSMACAQWESHAVGAYTGDFSAKTNNPILVASNLYDGHTPIRSARNVSTGFEGSGMLVVRGCGVSTLEQFNFSQPEANLDVAHYHGPGFCVHDQAHCRVLARGNPATQGFHLRVDEVPYGNYTWEDAIKAASSQQGNGSTGGGSQSPPKSGSTQVLYSLSTLVLAVASALVLQL